MILELLLALQIPAGAQWPAVSTDGRVAYESGGDLYLLSSNGAPTRLTSGGGLDRQPAWSPDGRTLVFVSDRSGNAELWSIAVDPAGRTGTPERLTTTADEESEPAFAADGSIVFVRGVEDADLWVRAADGKERKLLGTAGVERSPAVSRGGIVAYIGIRDGRRQLRSIKLDGTQDRLVLAEPQSEFPAWSPTGDRLAFVSTAPRRVVMITNAEGAFANTVSTRRGKPAWLPSGDSLLLAEIASDNVGYNGDPDRGIDRDAERGVSFEGKLWRVLAPAAPDAGLAEVPATTTLTDSAKIDYLERAAQRVSTLYFSRPAMAETRARWESNIAEFRSRAARAANKNELDQVVHELMQRRPPLRAEAAGRAGVSSAHPLATEAGLELFRRGGNVVDAAVAVSFALGVVEPDASGIGGYGQMLIHIKGNPEPSLIEFMSRAPEAATADNPALLGELGGPAMVNIPGTVDGMWRAWQRFGSKKVTWAQLLEPAIRLAEQGFVLDDAFPTTLRREQAEYLKHESTRALFFRNGRPLAAGDTLRNPDLAWTLKEIAKGGADAFYRGEIARRMVTDLRAKGNAMTTRDMARYFAAWRDPVSGTYRGHSVYSSAPPVNGGALLVGQLNLLEHHTQPKKPTEDAATLHALIEAWKLTPRARVADPDLWPVDIAAALTKDTARTLWSCFFSPNRALRQRDLGPRTDSTRRCPNTATDGERGDARDELLDCEAAPADPVSDRKCRSTGTTSFAVADGDGNMVAVTQTLGTWGGNFYVTPGLGFIYNDKLRSYSGGGDGFGARLPFARHGSTIAPTLVFRGTGADKKPLLATGAAGNAWINAAVYQIVTGVIDYGLGPQQALELPRFLPGGQSPTGESIMQVEAGFSPAMLARLEAMGHRFNPISLAGELRMGYAAAVMVDGGRVRAGGDPRRSGSGGAVR